ncbi:MAG: hypothetical protein R3B97_09725 [Dehalococcoidia bacterium]|nr:hypothetical protein [Dehalococcoidia bacterium]MCB9484807.1 hypothetical protein [Thermoflexaceae bacterium]
MTPPADGVPPCRSRVRSITRFWWVSIPLALAFGAVAIRPLFADGMPPEPPDLVTLSQLAETRTVPVAPDAQLVVQVGRGDITVTVGEPGFVHFTVTRYANADTHAAATLALETVHVLISGGDPVLSFVISVDRAFETTTAVSIEIPPGMPLKAETLAGDLTLDGSFTGRIEAGTGAGTLEIRLPANWHIQIGADAREVLSDLALEPVGDALPTIYRTPGTDIPDLELVLRALAGPIIVRER